MKLIRLAEALYAAPWHIMPESHRRLQGIFESHLAGPRAGLFDDDDGDEGDDSTQATPYQTACGIAIVSVDGVIGKRLSLLETRCGGCDIDAVISAVTAAVADPSIASILLDISSPGGQVTGTPEAAAQLRALSSQKPLYAFTDSQMCSAAYWLGAMARGIFCTPSSQIGSIGTYLALVDSSRAYEMEGMKLELFRAGRLKGIGIEGKAMTPEEKDFLQSTVDRANARFLAAVRSSRPGVSEETTQGQWFDGDQAVEMGLADMVVGSLQEALSWISAN